MKKHIRKFFHRFFIPGHHNNHHAPVVSHMALSAYLVLAVVSFVVLRNIGLQTGNVLGFATDVSVDRVLELTNERRVSSNLKPLTFNTQLAQAAHAKAEDMFLKGYWSHFGPSGESPWNFILGAGYQYEYAGENLAKNFMSSTGVVEAWMNSPTHRDNILNPNYTEIGISVVNGNIAGEDTTLVVEMFGSKSKIMEQAMSRSVSTASPLLPTTTPFPGQKTLIQAGNQAIPITPQNGETTKPLQKGELNNSLESGAPPKSTSLNLFPAFRILTSIAIAFLITVFSIDLYHISKTQYHAHRGKHIAHLIFLVAILIGIYFLGRGAIL